MADQLSEISTKVSNAIISQARRFRRTSLFVKVALVSVASTIAAIAQFAQFPPEGPTTWQIVGIASSLIVAIGGFFVIITEENAPTELALAQKAVEAARDAEAKYEVIDQLEDDLLRLVELYQAMGVMRSVIESLAAAAPIAEEEVAKKILKASERSLAIAMDFAQADQWTLGVYRAEPGDEPNRAVLRCIAHKRAIECDTSEARVWKEGTGIAGVAYSNGDEIVVPDLQADGLSAVFGTSANVARPYDSDRYRSMVAVPIKVDGMSKPWGVVAATNDRVEHFNPPFGSGPKPDEGARTLAGMIALGIAVTRRSAVTP